jgi:hypothetical protein
MCIRIEEEDIDLMVEVLVLVEQLRWETGGCGGTELEVGGVIQDDIFWQRPVINQSVSYAGDSQDLRISYMSKCTIRIVNYVNHIRFIDISFPRFEYTATKHTLALGIIHI